MKLRKVFFRRQPKSTFKLLHQRFTKHSEDLLLELEDKHKDTIKWLSSKGINPGKIARSGSKGALAGLAAGFVMLSTGLAPHQSEPQPKNSPHIDLNQIVGDIKSRQVLEQKFIENFKLNLPKNKNNLTGDESSKLAQSVSEISGFSVKNELSGYTLNTNFGKIGLEQHLPRYPGETIHDHFESSAGANRYGKSGITRNRGAFGYFANNKFELTPEAVEKEKYYVVVQTFAIDGWGKNKAMRDWFKHRKVLVVNTENGKAAVGVIADSGPARWTGKSFGGSPELMDQIGMYQGNRKSKVLVFFVDDHDNSVKLGGL
jgi:hypothetical protein